MPRRLAVAELVKGMRVRGSGWNPGDKQYPDWKIGTLHSWDSRVAFIYTEGSGTYAHPVFVHDLWVDDDVVDGVKWRTIFSKGGGYVYSFGKDAPPAYMVKTITGWTDALVVVKSSSIIEAKHGADSVTLLRLE